MFTSTCKFHRLLLEKMKLSGKNKSQALALSIASNSNGDSPFMV